MASFWFIQNETASENDVAGELLTFEQLAQRLADRRLSESDLVRSETGDTWQPVESVIGLVRAAERIRAERVSHEPSAILSSVSQLSPERNSPPDHRVEEVAENHTVETMRTAWNRPLPVATIFVSATIVCGIGWFLWAEWGQSRRFPKPAHLRDQSEPFLLPIIGPVSFFEFTLLIADLVILASLATWWLFLRQRR